MLLRFRPKKTNANALAATTLHCAALTALWMSAAPFAILLNVTLAIGLSLFAVFRALKASAAITSIHFQALSTQICLHNKQWLRVKVTPRRCDRLVVVLRLECLDSDSVFFEQHWFVWIIPGALGATEQRRLRRLIRWQLP
jgi:hypothetical protein